MRRAPQRKVIKLLQSTSALFDITRLRSVKRMASVQRDPGEELAERQNTRSGSYAAASSGNRAGTRAIAIDLFSDLRDRASSVLPWLPRMVIYNDVRPFDKKRGPCGLLDDRIVYAFRHLLRSTYTCSVCHGMQDTRFAQKSTFFPATNGSDISPNTQ